MTAEGARSWHFEMGVELQRRRPEEAALTRERIIATALGLIGAEGSEALTMRRVAAELGVGTMTLYVYFRSKREILDAMVDALSARVEAPASDGDWAEELCRMMRSIRGLFRAYPGLFRVVEFGTLSSTGAIRVADSGLRLLRRAGFDATAAGRAWDLLIAYTVGFAAMEVPRAVRPREAAESRRVWHERVASLPSSEYTAVKMSAPQIAAWDSDDQYEWGLRVLVAGLRPWTAGGPPASPDQPRTAQRSLRRRVAAPASATPRRSARGAPRMTR